MKGILDFFEAIKNGVVAAIEFLADFIEDVVYMVTLVGKFVAKIPEYFGWLPSSLLALVVMGFGVVVVYKILGREG